MTQKSHACHCSNEFCNADNSLKLLESRVTAVENERDNVLDEISSFRAKVTQDALTIHTLEKERDALRGALEKISSMPVECLSVDIAKAALSRPTEGERCD